MKNVLFLIVAVLLATTTFAQSTVTIGQTLSFQSVNYPAKYIKHQNSGGIIGEAATDADKESATYKVVAALDGREGYFSLESVNFPGHYLRHQGFIIKLHKPNGSALFNKDASFKAVAGLAGQGVTFESSNYPGQYIRHQGFVLKLNKSNNSPLFNKDASFNVQDALSKKEFNPLTDMIANSNPSGAWEFGYGGVGGTFVASTKMITRETASIWASNEGWKGVYLNPANGKDITLSQGLVLKPNTVMMHPGNKADHVCKIKFTAPTDGTYNVDVTWTAIDVQAKKTFTWIYTNAASQEGTVYDFTPAGFKEIFGKEIVGHNSSSSFSRVITMKKGEIIQFEMGNGGDQYYDDSLAIDLNITKK